MFDHRVRCFWLCYLVRCRRTNSPGFVTKIWHWLPRHGRLSWRRICGGCRWSTAWSPRNRCRKGRQSLYFFGGKRLPNDPFLTSLGCGYVYNRPGTEAERGNKVCTFVGGQQYPSDLFLTSLGCGYVYNRPGTEAEMANKVCTFVGGEQYPSDLFLTSLGCGYMCNPPGTEAERGNKVCSFWWVKNIPPIFSSHL